MYPTVDYQADYKTTYGGTLIDNENEFKQYALESCNFINELSFGKFANTEWADAQLAKVKTCICALSDYLKKDSQRIENSMKSSETVGPHSVSYNPSVIAKKNGEVYIEKKRLVYTWLASTGIFYSGVC